MTEIMTFNGVEMSQYFRITDIIRPIGNKRTVSTDTSPFLGVNIQEIKIGAKEHKIKFDIKGKSEIELEQLKHDLAGVFNVDKPVKITYADEPDKYYLGLPVDDISHDNITRWFQRSEITILIPDGVAHSVTDARFEEPTWNGNKMTFKINNEGNVDAYPIITIKHNSENGYVGLVSQNGAFELGSKEEADSEEYKKSEILFDYTSNTGPTRILNGYEEGKFNEAISNVQEVLDGQLEIDNAWGRPHIHLKNGTSASITWDIPADSAGEAGALYEYIWWRQIFWAGHQSQYGFMKVVVSDENGQFLYGTETFKRSNSLTTEYNFMVSDGKGGYRFLDRYTFWCTHLDSQNPFNEPRGWSDIYRKDGWIQFFWSGQYKEYNIPEIKGKKSAKVSVIFGSVGGKPGVTHVYLDDIVYRKDFVTGTRDIPNRYAMGSTVVIDNETNTVTKDGLNKNSDIVQGSHHFLSVPPGESELDIYFSSWIKKMPTVKVEFENRSL